MVPNVIERVWVQGTTTKVESLRGTAFTEEDGAHTFRIAGVDASGETVSLSGTVLAKILRADNITIDVSGTITDGVASVTMVGDCYHVPGRFSIVVYLSDGVTTIAIYAAVGDIYRATSDTELDSGTTVPSLVQLEAAYQNALSATAAANTAATGAERVNVSMSKSGDTITFSATDRTGATTTATMSDQSEEVADLESDVTDLENNVANLNSAIVKKADQVGVYPDLTAGTAEQLLSNDAIVNTTPYLFRPTGDSTKVGNREMVKKIVGGTVAWNQLVPTTAQSKTAEGVTFTNNGDGSWTVNGTASSNSATLLLVTAPKSINGHVVYLCGCPADGGNGKYRLYINGLSIGVDTGNGAIGKPTGLAYPHVQMHVYNGYTVENQVWKPQLFDLTAMFGPTIADYIYNLETATPGAGVAWFRRYFQNDYYQYNPGELIGVSGLQSHDMVWFNQWDEETVSSGYFNTAGLWVSANTNLSSKNAIPVQPNTIYYLKAPANIYIHFFKTAVPSEANSPDEYISRSNFIHDTTFTTPPNCHAIHFNVTSAYGTTYNHDICINLSHSGSRNGEYEPYEKHSFPLDSTITLRGMPKLDANGNLYFEGDEYTPDGVVARKKKERTFNGTETWRKDALANGYDRYYIEDNDIERSNKYVGMIANNRGYEIASSYAFTTASSDIAISAYSSSSNIGRNWLYIGFKESLGMSTLEAFTQWLSENPLTVLVNLAAPTTETAEPYQEIQICSDGGTEEFVTGTIVPVGHETRYPANLVKKLDGLPWNFSTLIAPTEETITASRAYTVGSYLIYQNTLYKVTSAIASGGTITPGTNVTATTIMEELTALA